MVSGQASSLRLAKQFLDPSLGQRTIDVKVIDSAVQKSLVPRPTGALYDIRMLLSLSVHETTGSDVALPLQVSEALENDPSIPPHILQKLHQTYNLIDSA